MRTKHIEPNPLHAWAHQTREWGANATRSLSFRGIHAYSYAACIGAVETLESGEKVYYVSSRTYSNTTSRHQRDLRSSIPGYALTVDMGLRGLGESQATEWFTHRIAELMGKAKRARTYAQYHLRGAQELHALHVRYAAAKGWANPGEFPDTMELQAKIAGYAAQAEAKRAAEQAEAIERERERKEQWLAGENVYPPVYGCYLRTVPGKPETVETNRRARVPLADVLRVLPLVLSALEHNRALLPRGSMTLGNYPFAGMSEDGTVTVGCHRFDKEEILRFAATLNA